MLTVQLNEPEANAITAGLILRTQTLARDLGRRLCDPPSPNRDFAIECLREGIRDAERARLTLARAYPEPEYEPSMTFGELAEAWGK